MLNKINSGVVFYGDLEGCAAFAAWFRSIVPMEQPLIFSDDSQEMEIELTPNITELEIMARVFCI